MILALAGRRIDAANTKERRFPIENTEGVEARIRELFERLKPRVLVCSAASGADLLALDVALEMAIERRVILPFSADVFRNTSVADRPGSWGERFDQIIRGAESEGRLECLNYSDQTEEAYVATNQALVKRAQAVAAASGESAAAVVVWNGASGNGHDITLQFKQAAEAAGLPIIEIPTL